MWFCATATQYAFVNTINIIYWLSKSILASIDAAILQNQGPISINYDKYKNLLYLSISDTAMLIFQQHKLYADT